MGPHKFLPLPHFERCGDRRPSPPPLTTGSRPNMRVAACQRDGIGDGMTRPFRRGSHSTYYAMLKRAMIMSPNTTRPLRRAHEPLRNEHSVKRYSKGIRNSFEFPLRIALAPKTTCSISISLEPLIYQEHLGLKQECRHIVRSIFTRSGIDMF